MRFGVTRLNADGSFDTGFNSPDTGAPAVTIETIAVQNDGKVLIAGYLSFVNGVSRNGIARLNANGTLDTSFNPGSGAIGIRSIALQGDGKIVIAGSFFSVNGVNRNGVARLNGDGSLDSGFDTGTGGFMPMPVISGQVSCLAVQTNGQILIGGSFFIGPPLYRGIARLNADGSVDSSFDGGYLDAGVNVTSVALQGDGRIVVGGNFTRMDGASRRGVARLNGSLPGALLITSSPRSQITAVGLSATFSVVATSPTPIRYQWFTNYWTEMNPVAIPNATNASYVISSAQNSDAFINYTVVLSNSVGSVTSSPVSLVVYPPAPPIINFQPQSQTVGVGQSASFTVIANANTPMSYQWRKNGSAVPGATSSNLFF